MWGFYTYMDPLPPPTHPIKVIIIFSRKFHNVFTIATEILFNNYFVINPTLKYFKS
jgi:hypothetical protein